MCGDQFVPSIAVGFIIALKLRVLETPTGSVNDKVASCCAESGTSADARPAARMPARIKLVENMVDGKRRLVLLPKSKMRNEPCSAINAAGRQELEQTQAESFRMSFVRFKALDFGMNADSGTNVSYKL